MYYYLTPKSIAFNSSFSDLKAKVNFFLALTLLKEKVINIARKKEKREKTGQDTAAGKTLTHTWALTYEYQCY